MVRKLFKSLLSLSLIAPLGAYALGLGEVQLHSSLNERLDAEIELLSVSPAEAQNLEVSLASQETFDKIGLERPAILMFLKFDVVDHGAGNYAIKVSSVESIDEPFLDFLVEVKWKSGRVLREYTLLLDPPSGYTDAAPAVSTPSTAATAATAPVTSEVSTQPAGAEPSYAEMEAVAEEGMSPEAEVVAEGEVAAGDEMAADREVAAEDERAAGEPMEARAPVPVKPQPEPTKTAPSMPSGAIVYGPVKADETLWSIAQRLRPNDDVTIQQMMLALQRANPYAFIDNNINRLKRGYVLRIDDPSAIAAMGKANAVREVARQNRAWQDYRESVAAKAQQRPAKAGALEPAPAAAEAAKKEPKLKLVAPEGKGADSAAPSGTAEGKPAGEVSEELMLALESSAAQRKENETLRTRMLALEGQLEDMEKIITLKDADLAALQQQLREQGKDATLPSEKLDEEKQELLVKPGEEAAEQAVAAESKAEDQLTEPAAETAAKPEEAAAEAQAKPVEELKPEQKKPVERKRPKVVPPPPPPPKSFIEEMLEDTMMLGIAGGALLLLLLLVLLLIKRRRKGGFQESILNVGGTSSMMKASDEQGSETSFLSDLAISGMGPGTIQTDEGEADPITEAEVFLAYGRNQQAEEVLRKALDVSPNRTDITAKLLEVYFAGKEKEKFEALVEEAVGGLQADDALWGKVLVMGHELCPQNVLFEGAAASSPAPSGPAAGGQVMDIGLDLDEVSAEMESDAGGDLDLDLGLDFDDLEEGGETEQAPLETADMGELDLGLPAEEPAAEESSDLEMDLGALEMESGAEVEESAGLDFDFDLGATEEAESATELEEGGMDFDLDLGAADEAVAEESGEDLSFDMGDFGVAEEEAAGEELGFDLDMGELTTEAEEGAADMSLDMDMDLGDLGSSLQESADEGVSLELDAALDDLGGFDELGDLDDLGELSGEDDNSQKLDLAQAYAEMGDAEGARSMLEEVIADGNDEQKQQAKALLDKI